MRSSVHGAFYEIDSALINETHHKKIKYFDLIWKILKTFTSFISIITTWESFFFSTKSSYSKSWKNDVYFCFIELTAKKYVNKLSIMSKQMHHSKEEENECIIPKKKKKIWETVSTGLHRKYWENQNDTNWLSTRKYRQYLSVVHYFECLRYA